MPSSTSVSDLTQTSWERPVTALPGIGPALAERLARLEIQTVGDALFHLPSRYEDRTRIESIRGLRIGQSAIVEGEILAAATVGRARASLLVELADDSGLLRLRFFHFNAALRRKLSAGGRVSVYGELRLGPLGQEMVHPEVRGAGEPSLREATLTPVYPSTEGLSMNALRRTVRAALTLALPDLAEYLPAASRPSGLTLAAALRLLHAPPPGCDLAPARAVLAFEELVTHHAHLLTLRHAQGRSLGRPCRVPGRLLTQFLEALPFMPTKAQTTVIAEIRRDLEGTRPMRRVLQGDVGSGKTLVAAAAALLVIEAGYQVAIMAPTELLARQHRETFGHWLQPLGIEPLGLMRLGAGAAALRAKARDGETRLVVGTQAMFQEAVGFERLGLVVIDEQHRFGVQERQALTAKGRAGAHRAHLLAMSATPIPRTLAQSAYADLDLSILDERPPGRAPVTTVALAENRREEVVERVRVACLTGAKAYWVCPLIEEGEQDLKAAAALHAELAQALAGIRVGLIHGRMKATDKDQAMEAFARGPVQVLVATTVIEVGVDVPAASLLVIENAERLGLAQLHQLRGRIGRGGLPGHCVLLYKPPLGDMARERIACLRETDDGFLIARRDLALRGAGEVFGVRQTGLPGFRVADLIRDEAMLPAVARAAAALVQGDPAPLLGLRKRWLRERHELGSA